MKWRLWMGLCLLLPEWPLNPFLGPAAPSWRHLLGRDDLGRDALGRLLVASGRSLGFASAVALMSLAIALALHPLARRLPHLLAGLRALPPLLWLIPLAAWVGPFGWVGLSALLAAFLGLALEPALAEHLEGLRHSNAWRQERLMGATFSQSSRRWAPWVWATLQGLLPMVWIQALWGETALRSLGLGPPPGHDTLGRILQEELPWLAQRPTYLGLASLAILLGLAWSLPRSEPP